MICSNCGGTGRVIKNRNGRIYRESNLKRRTTNRMHMNRKNKITSVTSLPESKRCPFCNGKGEI